MRSIHTDLAMEARELNIGVSGVTEDVEEVDGVRVSRITVESEAAARRLGKAMGHYITLDAPALAQRDTTFFTRVEELLAEEIDGLIAGFSLPDRASILVVGLGNRFITPDALGPRVAEKAFVTRHIVAHLPDIIGEPMRPVAAIAPGVLGITGMETAEVLRGLVERIKPDAVIAIDALASRRAARISATVQLCDTGVAPGSGVGNLRDGINAETLGVPVIAMGVPTVVMASTISQDTIRLIANETGLHRDEEKLIGLAEQVLDENYGPLIVTPKEIDTIIGDMAGILAGAINRSLHRPYFETIKELMA